jgi:transposase
MEDITLFQLALGILPPWQVRECSFSADTQRLDIWIDFQRGSAFACPSCGVVGCKAYDTEELEWRHLNFFQYHAYLHARTPRVECSQCGVKRVTVPWARAGSGFTLLFEAFVMTLAHAMPVLAVARLVGEHDTLIWRIVHHYIDSARAIDDHSGVSHIGVDETAARRGHDYVSLFVDLKKRKVLFATEGKDAATVKAFAEDLKVHGGNAEAVQEVSIDMSPAFISGVENYLSNASVTFDKFHLVKTINDAVDEVRRQEQKGNPALKSTRYVWLKNLENLTGSQVDTLVELDITKSNLKTAKAYRIKLAFQELYNQPKEEAEDYLRRWYFWATHSRIQPIIEAARTIKNHWDGVLRWFDSNINNGILEGINSLVQAAKAKARGYRSNRNFIAIIYLIAGKLPKQLPT